MDTVKLTFIQALSDPPRIKEIHLSLKMSPMKRHLTQKWNTGENQDVEKGQFFITKEKLFIWKKKNQTLVQPTS